MTREPLERLRAADPLRGTLPAALSQRPALEPKQPRWSGERLLLAANAVLLASVLLHSLDHTLQDRGLGALSFEVMLAGSSLLAAAGLSLYVAWRRHGRAPIVALLAGPWVAVAIVAGHFLPHWGEFSDPYTDAGVGFISYAIAMAAVLDGLILGALSIWTLHVRSRHHPGG